MPTEFSGTRDEKYAATATGVSYVPGWVRRTCVGHLNKNARIAFAERFGWMARWRYPGWMARWPYLYHTLRRQSSGRYLANTMPDVECTLPWCRMVTRSAMLPNSRTGMRWGRALGKLRACKSHSSRRQLRGGGGGKAALHGQSRDRKVLLKTPTTTRSRLICRRVRGLCY